MGPASLGFLDGCSVYLRGLCPLKPEPAPKSALAYELLSGGMRSILLHFKSSGSLQSQPVPLTPSSSVKTVGELYTITIKASLPSSALAIVHAYTEGNIKEAAGLEDYSYQKPPLLVEPRAPRLCFHISKVSIVTLLKIEPWRSTCSDSYKQLEGASRGNLVFPCRQ
jgi:hypothetical protein